MAGKPRPPQTHFMRRRSRPIVAGGWSRRACYDPHAVVAFMTDGIVTTRRLEGLPNVVNEGEESRLGDWEYAPVEGGTFLHAGVYSMRKAGKELTKTRGVDPKRVSADEMPENYSFQKLSRP